MIRSNNMLECLKIDLTELENILRTNFALGELNFFLENQINDLVKRFQFLEYEYSKIIHL